MYFSVCVSCLNTTGPKGNGKSASVKSRSVLKSSTGTAAGVVSGSESASTDPSSSVPRTRRVTSGMYSSFCMTLCINYTSMYHYYCSFKAHYYNLDWCTCCQVDN